MISLKLDDTALATLFPFHFRLDRDLHFMAVSPVLARLMPTLRVGAAFTDHFLIERPVVHADFATLADCRKLMFLLRAKRRIDEEDLLMRGQVMFFAESDELLFVGNPRVRDLDDLKRLGLTMRDFAVDSTMTDYLVLIRTQQTALAEAQRLAADLARARDAAQMASNSKSEFLANMSHELRTPLNAILGFSEMIMSQFMGPIPDTYQGYAADIHKSGHLLLLIINDVLDMARIEAGYHTLDEGSVNIDEIVQECIHLLEARAEEREITLSYQSDLPGVLIKADARAMKQICLNLLSNAVKFNKWDGDVAIHFRRQADGNLALSFADTGLGIPAEALPRLFRPFQQAGATTTRTFGGTGLGLSITRNLVEMHGGHIDLVSELDQGSTFTVVLPGERLI